MNINSKVFFDYECALELFSKIISEFSGISIEHFYDHQFLENQVNIFYGKEKAKEVSMEAFGKKKYMPTEGDKRFYKLQGIIPPEFIEEKPAAFYEFVRQIRRHDWDKIFLPTEIFNRFKNYIKETDFKTRLIDLPENELEHRARFYYTTFECNIIRINNQFEKGESDSGNTFNGIGGLDLLPFGKAKFWLSKDKKQIKDFFTGRFEVTGSEKMIIRIYLQNFKHPEKKIEIILPFTDTIAHFCRGKLTTFPMDSWDIYAFYHDRNNDESTPENTLLEIKHNHLLAHIFNKCPE